MITLKIEGMACSGCVSAVAKAIAAADPTSTAEIDLERGIAEIQTVRPQQELMQAIEAAGYEVTPA